MMNYKYVIEDLMSKAMKKDERFNHKEYIWVLGKKVVDDISADLKKDLKAEVQFKTLCGIEVHEGRDYGDEVIMLLRDVTKAGSKYLGSF